jgi:7,8-dihydropterin-6-yl-methyl-4-(beta-D-ribofuranosyl)aminobenzene 5'-phosphate synthase
MSVKATVLVENSVHGNLGAVAEHGWSVWLETPEGNYVFDTGQGNALLRNAEHFGVQLATARGVLLSHHHLDHTGGLLGALGAMRRGVERTRVPVYAHPDLFKDSFLERDGALQFTGLPHTRSALETAGADFVLATGWRQIAPGMRMTGEVPRLTTYETGEPNLKHRDASGAVVTDPVRDDQTLVLDTPDGLLVLLGCSHAGLVNILTYIRSQTGVSRFHTIMGGTHLGPAGEEQVEQTLAALRQFDIGRIGVSHCTGPRVTARMASVFGERFFFCNVGTIVEA